MGRFRCPRQALQSLSVHDQIATSFRPKRLSRADAFSQWYGYASEMAV